MGRIAGVCAALTVVGLLAAGVAAGSNRATSAGGPVRIFATAGNGITGRIVIAGAIGDYGKTFTMDKNGKGDANGNYVRITLKKGTFLVDSTALNKKTDNAPPSVFDKATCSYGFSGTGPVTLSDGTGAYAGISGSISITVNFGAVGPLLKSGPKKGTCNLSDNAQPIATGGYILGKGTVKFS
jgi:hypothetical protein